MGASSGVLEEPYSLPSDVSSALVELVVLSVKRQRREASSALRASSSSYSIVSVV